MVTLLHLLASARTPFKNAATRPEVLVAALVWPINRARPDVEGSTNTYLLYDSKGLHIKLDARNGWKAGR